MLIDGNGVVMHSTFCNLQELLLSFTGHIMRYDWDSAAPTLTTAARLKPTATPKAVMPRSFCANHKRGRQTYVTRYMEGRVKRVDTRMRGSKDGPVQPSLKLPLTNTQPPLPNP
eukprot:1155146-Pelagomonas_calceolata.AAC.5